MDLGVLEGQTSRGLFSNSIFDPSVIGATVHSKSQIALIENQSLVKAGLCCSWLGGNSLLNLCLLVAGWRVAWIEANCTMRLTRGFIALLSIL